MISVGFPVSLSISTVRKTFIIIIFLMRAGSSVCTSVVNSSVLRNYIAVLESYAAVY